MDLGSTIGFLLIRMQKRIMRTILKWFSHGSGMCLKLLLIFWIIYFFSALGILEYIWCKNLQAFLKHFISNAKIFCNRCLDKLSMVYFVLISNTYKVFIDLPLLIIYLAKWKYFKEPLGPFIKDVRFWGR